MRKSVSNEFCCVDFWCYLIKLCHMQSFFLLVSAIVERISVHVFIFSNTGAYRNVTPLKYRTNKSVITSVCKIMCKYVVVFLRLYILNYFYIQWHIIVVCCDRKIGTINTFCCKIFPKVFYIFIIHPQISFVGVYWNCCAAQSIFLIWHATCLSVFSGKKNQTSVGKCFHIRGYMGKT